MGRQEDNLSGRYGRAFLDAAVEAGKSDSLEEIGDGLRSLAELVLSKDGTFFLSPVFSIKEKASVLDLIQKKRKIHPLSGRFAQILVSERQLQLLPDIVKTYEKALRVFRKELLVKVSSAFPLKTAQKEALKKAFTKQSGKLIDMEVCINPELIGGCVVEAGGVVYDGSIQGYLRRLKEAFVS